MQVTEGATPGPGLLILAAQVSLLQNQDSWPGIAPPTMGWVLPANHLLRKFLQAGCYRGTFSLRFLSFQMTLASVKLT